MKVVHVPAGFDEKPCLRDQRIKGKKTGFRCTKAEGHTGDHAAIGSGTLYQTETADLRMMSEKNASDHMSRLRDKGGKVHTVWKEKKKAA